MESLAYIHQAIAYEDLNPSPTLVLWQSFNGQKRPSAGWLKFLWIGAIVAATISLSEAAQAATVKVQTTSGNGLLARAQPSTDAARIGVGLDEGAVLEVADTNTPGWYVITSGAYKNNYIASQYTVPVGVGGDPLIPGATGKMQVKTDTGLGLNVRSAPTASSSIVGGLSEGEIIGVTASDNPGWSKITEGNYIGSYVSNTWLTSLGSVGSVGSVGTVGNGTMPENNPVTERNYVIKTNSGRGVQVRALPIETSQRVDGLDDGAKVTAKASGTNGWLQITSGNLRGSYIRDRWAVPSDGSVTVTPVVSGSSANYAVKTNSGIGVVVRSNPSNTSGNLGGLNEGDVVTAVVFNSEWLQIVSGPKAGGYISRQWAMATNGIRNSYLGTGNYVVNTNKDELVVRSAPRDTAGAIGGLPKGQRISAVASGTSGWLRITEGPYAGAYISSTWVALANSNVALY